MIDYKAWFICEKCDKWFFDKASSQTMIGPKMICLCHKCRERFSSREKRCRGIL